MDLSPEKIRSLMDADVSTLSQEELLVRVTAAAHSLHGQVIRHLKDKPQLIHDGLYLRTVLEILEKIGAEVGLLTDSECQKRASVWMVHIDELRTKVNKLLGG